MTLKVAVIGGGPAGLVTLKYLVEAHKFFPGAEIEAHLFEARDDIGGVFRYNVYEDAELVSSKYLTAFSDFRISQEEADFITPEKYVDYLKAYADKFDLWKHIHCSTTVQSIEPHPTEPGHIVHTHCHGTDEAHRQIGADDGTIDHSRIHGPHHYHAVAICSGLNRVPFIPHIPGLQLDSSCSPKVAKTDGNSNHENENKMTGGELATKPTILHSSAFKTRAQFGKDATVLILGAGETAMDMAHLAITSPTKRVLISHRDGFCHAPKIVPQPYRAGKRSGGPDPARPNKPLDCAIASLFDTAYVPGFLQRGPLLWIPYDAFVKNMAWTISGTRAGFDQWVGGVSPERFHVDALLFCKSDRALPYISAPWRSTSTLNKWRTWLINLDIKPTGGKVIDMAPWPTHFDDDGAVHFEKNDRPESKKIEQEEKPIKPDVIIFATGYDRFVDFLPEGDTRYPPLKDCSTRGIYRSIYDGIAYIGFIRPAFGAIPPLAELQAQRWVHDLIYCPKYRLHLSPSFQAQEPTRSPHAIKPYELKYKLRFRGGGETHNFASTKRGVDQESYAYQLAVDMGAAPTALHVLRRYGPWVFYTWAMGPNFPTKFRLMGPWSNPEVAEAAAAVLGKDGELGRIVRKTGGGVFIVTYTLIPLFIFAPLCTFLNILYWIFEACINAVQLTGMRAAPCCFSTFRSQSWHLRHVDLPSDSKRTLNSNHSGSSTAGLRWESDPRMFRGWPCELKS